MNYELAKQLKDSGFPNVLLQNSPDEVLNELDCPECIPTLSELIEACGSNFWALYKSRFGQYTWSAHSNEDQWNTEISYGSTPEEAVAKLWLELNKK